MFFPNSNNDFGVFRQSKGFGAELLSEPLWFCGADPPRLRQGFTKVAQVLWCLWSSGQIRFGVPKGSAKGPLSPSFNLSPSSSTFFWHFSPTALALPIVKVLGQNDTFVLRGSLQQMVFASKKVLWSSTSSSLHWSHSLLRFFGQMAFASEKVLWRVLPTILYICLPNDCCFIKVFWRVPPNALRIFLPVFCWVKVAWIVDTSHPYTSSLQKDPSCRDCWGILWVKYLKFDGV